MNRTAYRVLLGKIWENLKIQSSDDENLVLKSKKRMFRKKNADWDAKIGVDTSENLTKNSGVLSRHPNPPCSRHKRRKVRNLRSSSSILQVRLVQLFKLRFVLAIAHFGKESWPKTIEIWCFFFFNVLKRQISEFCCLALGAGTIWHISQNSTLKD